MTEARGQWQAQTAALKAALTNLQTAVKSLTASPSASAVGGVVARRRAAATQVSGRSIDALSLRHPRAAERQQAVPGEPAGYPADRGPR